MATIIKDSLYAIVEDDKLVKFHGDLMGALNNTEYQLLVKSDVKYLPGQGNCYMTVASAEELSRNNVLLRFRDQFYTVAKDLLFFTAIVSGEFHQRSRTLIEGDLMISERSASATATVLGRKLEIQENSTKRSQLADCQPSTILRSEERNFTFLKNGTVAISIVEDAGNKHKTINESEETSPEMIRDLYLLLDSDEDKRDPIEVIGIFVEGMAEALSDLYSSREKNDRTEFQA